MYKIPASTLFVGKKLVYVPECHSTNTLSAELSQRGSVEEGTLVITSNQLGGRGQRGNQWISEPGKNLTFSLILKPTFLKPDQQFRLTQVVSLAVADYANSKAKGVKIKWPNDVLINNKKTCGILIENSISGECIQTSVVGVGFNVNQVDFAKIKGTSLKNETGLDFDLQNELNDLLPCIEIRYLQLRDGKFEKLSDDYLNRLYRKGQRHSFRIGNTEKQGVIDGVDQRGRLVVLIDHDKHYFDLKEISFVD
ncbi:MAG: biotin--[acetyl-CoA-carboxylase] ligase [Cyclobacteriaceae bacterium]|nr:biotin--[acetyl-CoA-carboxylase] ligase [Cyclobacteriaceae bacterium]